MTFKNYIDDPYFLKWIFRPDEPAEQYWKNYMESHPDEMGKILFLKDELSFLRMKNEDLSEDEKRHLLETILKKKEQTRPRSVSRILPLTFLRYAAVAVIFLALGSLLVYLFHGGVERSVNYSELTQLLPPGKPVILLADGREIHLGINSTVEYLANHTIVVDGRSVPVLPDRVQGHDQIVIPKGHRCKMILSDRSVIWLNAGSKLIYPSAFTGNTREVILSGEAFFEVSRNEDSRFTVQTTSIAVEVFGTKFNVSAYDEDPVIQTVLVEGQVSVRRNRVTSPKQPIVLEPDQMVIYNRQTQDFETSRVDPGFFTLWKEGMLKFENENLNAVTRKLERIYNMTVIFTDPGKGQMKISGKLDLNAARDQVLEYLKTLTGLQISALNETYYVIN